MQISISIAVKGRNKGAGSTPPTPPPQAPVNTTPPDISGTTTVGQTLTSTTGIWNHSPVSYVYQWKRGATDIGGAKSDSYVLVQADAGQSITCVVTATNATGSTDATSNAVQIQNFFTTTWTTTASSQTIILPYAGGGTYSGTINWGDGSTSISNYTNRTHTYATANTYTVVINGTVNGWDFSGIFGSTYITSVVHWGQLSIGDGAGAFSDCPNLDLSTVSDVLDLTGTTNFSYMFGFATSLTNINRIGEWNTSSITQMGAMFQGCDLINFNIGTWDVGNVTDFTDFMDSATTTFSTTNLNAIYNGWSASGVQPNCSINFGGAKYSAAGVAGKAVLTSLVLNNWTIIDGGLI